MNQLLTTDRVAKTVIVALQAELLVLVLTVDKVEVANRVLVDVKLFLIGRLIILPNAVFEYFAIDEDQFLREKRQVTLNDGVTRGDGVLFHRERICIA